MELKYRPEIDGLRTIAVLAVIIYHAEFVIGKTTLLAGGFLGVDIFFVISGFLITSLMLKELRQTGDISIAHFYERRARRLLPALLTVMLVSIPFAWLYLVPNQLVDYSWSLLSTIVFGSNFYWDYSLQEYGAQSGLLAPFLHTWSLAVEEQYYIVFPWMLLFIHRYCRQHAIAILSAGFLLSLTYAQWMTGTDKSFAFYMLPTRFWELLSGGLVAYMLHRHPTENRRALIIRALPAVGLLLIALAIALITLESDHPGFITLIPVIGTALILWSVNDHGLITRLLASKPMVYIGLISYSLYLWHYPIFAFGRIIDATPSLLDKGLWLVLTFTLSVISYHIVEKPFRKAGVFSTKGALTILGVVAIAIAIFSASAVFQDGYRERFSERIALYEDNEFDNKVLLRASLEPLNNLASAQGYGPSRCCETSEFEKSVLWFSGDSTRVLIIGDSHSKDVFNAFHLNPRLFRGYQFARYQIYSNDTQEQIEDLIASPNFRNADIVLFSMRYGTKPGENGGPSSLEALPDFIDALYAENPNIILASAAPVFPDAQKPKTLFDEILLATPDRSDREAFNSLVNTRYYQARSPSSAVRNEVVKEVAESKGIKYVSKAEVVCELELQQCFGVTPEGYKSFYDQGHWTIEGAKYFGERIYEQQWLNIDEKE